MLDNTIKLFNKILKLLLKPLKVFLLFSFFPPSGHNHFLE